MKSGIAVLLFVLVFVACASAADLSGKWELTARVLNDVNYARLTLKVDGGNLSGTLNEVMLDGTVKGDDTRATGAPRAENAEYLMSSGIGNSLTDALQLATTQLVTWLETEYKLTPNEAAVVLGTSMRYDIAEIVDPLVHVVAKIPKDAVAKLK